MFRMYIYVLGCMCTRLIFDKVMEAVYIHPKKYLRTYADRHPRTYVNIYTKRNLRMYVYKRLIFYEVLEGAGNS